MSEWVPYVHGCGSVHNIAVVCSPKLAYKNTDPPPGRRIWQAKHENEQGITINVLIVFEDEVIVHGLGTGTRQGRI